MRSIEESRAVVAEAIRTGKITGADVWMDSLEPGSEFHYLWRQEPRMPWQRQHAESLESAWNGLADHCELLLAEAQKPVTCRCGIHCWDPGRLDWLHGSRAQPAYHRQNMSARTRHEAHWWHCGNCHDYLGEGTTEEPLAEIKPFRVEPWPTVYVDDKPCLATELRISTRQVEGAKADQEPCLELPPCPKCGGSPAKTYRAKGFVSSVGCGHPPGMYLTCSKDRGGCGYGQDYEWRIPALDEQEEANAKA